MKRGGATGTNPAGTGADWGPIDEEDVVGTASARLLACGAPRRDRLDALSLLGLLVDHADAEGLVRLPFDTLVGEFGVASDRGRELLEALVAVEVVQVMQDDGMAVGAPPPEHPGAFRLSAFLANVTVVLDDGRGIDPGDHAVPYPVSPPRAPSHPGRRVRGRPTATRAAPRVLAAAAAAVVIMWSTAAPSGEPTAVRSVAAPSSATGRAPWATTPTTAGDVERLARTGHDATPLASSAVPVAPSAPMAGAGASPVGGPAPAQSASEEPDATSSGTAPPDRGSPAPDSPQPPRPPTPSPSSGSGPATPPDDIGVSCPVEQIESNVVDTRLQSAGSDLLDIVGAVGLEVTGTLRNPSGADLVVRSFEVSVIGSTESAAGSPTPLLLPAGGTASWRAILPTAISVPTQAFVEVRILDWNWADPVLEANCPG